MRHHKIRRWFTFSGTVGRGEYFQTGLLLMVLKYAVEASVIGMYSEKPYTPIDALNPLISVRAEFTEGAPGWVPIAWILWTLPFVWIAVTMSLRRCIDAGVSPWWSLSILTPLANYVAMILLSVVPSRKRVEAEDAEAARLEITTPFAHGRKPTSARRPRGGLESALVGWLSGIGFAIASVAFSTLLLESYGAALFFGSPVVAGTVFGYVYNRDERRTLFSTFSNGLLLVLLISLLFLVFALEGLICIVMALPIMAPMVLFGSVIGWEIARWRTGSATVNDRGMVGCLIALPMLMTAETALPEGPLYRATTEVIIDAAPEEVWDVVVAFPEITADPDWFFRMGIAFPQRARIVGRGVGAVRYCEFSTGAFVEPITVWDEPRRLAFDVTDQPDPMTELSPYRHLHPPHLDGSFRSERGEFLLETTSDGRTLLRGTTWYRLDLHPHAYWTVWTDWLLHRIHGRVLEHIKAVAEAV
ncbi:MAG: DUF805 domain-containing protein [Planctomycetota bacterium]